MATVHKVGAPFIPGRRRFDEGAQFTAGPSGTAFVLYMAAPRSAEVQDFRKGTRQWAWICGEHAAMVCLRTGTQPWQAAPFDPWLAPEGRRGAPGGNLVQMILVDADTGLVAALAAVSWPGEFAAGVGADIAALLARPHNGAAASAEIDAWMQIAPADLARTHATRRPSAPGPAAPADPQRNRADAAAVIGRVLHGLPVQRRPYPGAALPPELERWHVYLADAGHSILAVLDNVAPDGAAEDPAQMEGWMAPVPVKAVQAAGYRVDERGYLHTRPPYSSDTGLIVDPDHEEFA